MKRLSSIFAVIICMLAMAVGANAGAGMETVQITGYGVYGNPGNGGLSSLMIKGTFNVPTSLDDVTLRPETTAVAYGVDMNHCVDGEGQQVKKINSHTKYWKDVYVPWLTSLSASSFTVLAKYISEDTGMVSTVLYDADAHPNPATKSLSIFVGSRGCYTPDPERAYFNEYMGQWVCGTTPEPTCYGDLVIAPPGTITGDYFVKTVGN